MWCTNKPLLQLGGAGCVRRNLMGAIFSRTRSVDARVSGDSCQAPTGTGPACCPNTFCNAGTCNACNACQSPSVCFRNDAVIRVSSAWMQLVSLDWHVHEHVQVRSRPVLHLSLLRDGCHL